MSSESGNAVANEELQALVADAKNDLENIKKKLEHGAKGLDRAKKDLGNLKKSNMNADEVDAALARALEKNARLLQNLVTAQATATVHLYLLSVRGYDDRSR